MTQDDYVLGRSVGDSVRLAEIRYLSLTFGQLQGFQYRAGH